MEVDMAAGTATKGTETQVRPQAQPDKKTYMIPSHWLDPKRREEVLQTYMDRFPELSREEALKQLEEWGF